LQRTVVLRQNSTDALIDPLNRRQVQPVPQLG
jgi:hypothetical protein